VRIAFVNPPPLASKQLVEAEDCCWGVKGLHILPAMLLACASEAKRAGHEVAFFDLGIDHPPALRPFAAELVVYPLAWQYHREVDAAMQTICGRVPRLVLAVPPGYAPDYARLDPPPFAVAYSEPEFVCAHLPTDRAGLGAWRKSAPGIISPDGTSDRLPNCMAQLGPVDWSLVPPAYWQKYTIAIYQVTRGCPYRCGFCVWGGSTVTDRTFKTRPAKQVAADLQALRPLFVNHHDRPGALYLLSSQLTTSLSWLREFAALMGDHPFTYQSNVNLREMTKERVTLLEQSGMTAASAGLEAFTDPMLAKLGKPWTAKEALRGALLLEHSSIPLVGLHLRTGFGETDAEVRASIATAEAWYDAGIRRTKFNLGPIVHYAGTDIATNPPYELLDVPVNGASCYRMKHPPVAAWREFVAVTREFGWYVDKGILPLKAAVEVEAGV